jgi:hypothetical protein
MIERGIKLLIHKVLDLITSMRKNDIWLDDEQKFTALNHEQWCRSLAAVYNELNAWEMANVGEEQFAQIFRVFVDNIDQVHAVAEDEDRTRRRLLDSARRKSRTVLRKTGKMAGGSLYMHQDYENVSGNNPLSMFDSVEEREKKMSLVRYGDVDEQHKKHKFSSVSDVYLEQYKVAKGSGLLQSAKKTF